MENKRKIWQKPEFTKDELNFAYKLIKENMWSKLEDSNNIDEATELVAGCLKVLEEIKKEIGILALKPEDYEKIEEKLLY